MSSVGFPKVVLITGTSSGIGLASACYLAEKGFKVYASVRPNSDSTELDRRMNEIGKNLVKVVFDVRDEKKINEVVKQIIKETGRIDVLINNAAYAEVGTVESSTLEAQQDLFNVNYFGPVRLMQAVFPHMRANREGRIVNIGSCVGIVPFPALENYSATKFALEGVTESMAVSLCPWNIKVSIIEPGGVKTCGAEKQTIGTRFAEEGNPYAVFQKKGDEMSKHNLASGVSPVKVAELIHEVITAEKPHLRYQFGPYATQLAKQRFIDPTGDISVAEQIAFFASKGLIPSRKQLPSNTRIFKGGIIGILGAATAFFIGMRYRKP